MKNNILNFNQFLAINEAKISKEKIKIIALSNMSEESYTIPILEATCKKRGIECYSIDINTCIIEIDESMKNDLFISDSNRKKSIPISTENTAILCRRGIVRSTFTRDIVEHLENKGFFVVNSLESMMICENKYITSKILESYGVPIPKMAIIENEDGIEPAIKKIGGKFPLIMKLLSGSQGIGVSIIESEASLRSVLQTIWKLNSNTEVLIQEKIESDHDIRIHVLTRKFNSPKPDESDSVLLGYMRRNRVKNDFRTNHSLGGSAQKIKITKEQEVIALESAKAIGANWAAVDLMVDKKTGKNYVLEVNSSPGSKGLKSSTGINVIDDIVNFLIDKKNWIRNKRKVGFREVIHIEGIGDFVAKFDTGNGAKHSSLSFDEIEIAKDEKTVKWKIGEFEFENEIEDWCEPEVGTESHRRPVISLDIQFAGKTYKQIQVGLHDRKEKSTKFLVNRNFMENIGCIVSPSKIFVVTKFDEPYNPIDAKKNSHGGIIFKKLAK